MVYGTTGVNFDSVGFKPHSIWSLHTVAGLTDCAHAIEDVCLGAHGGAVALCRNPACQGVWVPACQAPRPSDLGGARRGPTALCTHTVHRRPIPRPVACCLHRWPALVPLKATRVHAHRHRYRSKNYKVKLQLLVPEADFEKVECDEESSICASQCAALQVSSGLWALSPAPGPT